MGWGRYTSDIITGKHEHVHTHTVMETIVDGPQKTAKLY